MHLGSRRMTVSFTEIRRTDGKAGMGRKVIILQKGKKREMGGRRRG